ncbi:MAG: tetratricopeptide repeat protein, partial [bacterium]
PKNAPALNNLGNLDFFTKDYAQAITYYIQATDADPQDPDYLMNLLKANLHLKYWDAAKKIGAQAVLLDPDLAPAVQALTENR